MPSAIVLGLRAAQLFLAFVVLGLSAYVANWYNVDTLTSSPSQINFLLFCSLFTILSVLYIEITPRFLPKFAHPIAVVALEATNVLFYFAGSIALAVFISKLLFCRGSVCGSARADVAFGFIEFLIWAGTAFFAVRDAMKGGFSFRPARRGQAPLGGSQMKEAQLP